MAGDIVDDIGGDIVDGMVDMMVDTADMDYNSIVLWNTNQIKQLKSRLQKFLS